MNSWDKVYSQKGMAEYPDNMVIRFVANNYYNVPNRKEVKFLDVGCGVGSNTWYIAKEGFSVAAIDSSPVAMEKLRKRLEKDKLEALLGCGDITQLDFKPDYFDAVIDVSSLCYIPEDKIKDFMEKLHTVLKPGGKIFSLWPTYWSVRSPFNHTIEGVDLNARFLEFNQIIYQFHKFKVKHATVSYPVKAGRVELWHVEGTKE